MAGKCIKVYVTEEEYKSINRKAEDNNLTLSKYLKIQGLREDTGINTKAVLEFSNLSKDFQELLEEYDIRDEHLKKINKRVDLICQNL